MSKEIYEFKCEYNYYVGVLWEDNELRFVDTVDYGNQTATLNAGATPQMFSKSSAIDLQVGLCCNGYDALVIVAPEFLSFQNKESVDTAACKTVRLTYPLEELK